MPEFINGRTLCEGFFFDCAKPVLDRNFPGLCYTAGLLGYGSDVLGYDDVTSTDHMWGPRFYLFLKPEDMDKIGTLMEFYSKELPCSYQGYSVHFSEPDPNDHGIRCAESVEEGPVNPLIFYNTVDGFLAEYLGISQLENLSAADWLSFSEHRLLALASGQLYVDQLGMKEKLDRLGSYPDLVRRYLIASQWSLIAEEQAFTKRCGMCGDDIGSRLVCARIAERLMRLCFLYQNRYAPYSKWFGTAFSRLAVDQRIGIEISAALSAQTLEERENHLVEAQVLVGELHNQSGLTEPVEYRVQPYFGRPIKVIFPDCFVDSLRSQLAGTELEGVALFGSLSQIGNFCTICDQPRHQQAIKALYHPETGC